MDDFYSQSASRWPQSSWHTAPPAQRSNYPPLDFSTLIPIYDESPHFAEYGGGSHGTYMPTAPDTAGSHGQFLRPTPQLWGGSEYYSLPHTNMRPASSSSSTTSSSPSLSTYFLPTPSQTPPPVPLPQMPRATHTDDREAQAPVAQNPNQKSCSHCHTTTTPLWRRNPTTRLPLCNACGLYLQQRNMLRPQALIDADSPSSSSTDEDDDDEGYTGPRCSHCHTRHTSVWRRGKGGVKICNACGVYARLRGKERPIALMRNRKVKPRLKHQKPGGGQAPSMLTWPGEAENAAG
ncbi:hypothetical protein FB45DRAFT_836589 [Roridomyces roridus]|uniref:GATA-type domain-containing protein n=1 Tax=Roridomyces roridus TaxID=1738132 RepID=A0AAD7BLI3_9AGAR|nr:hypothetical protein FB45DRAFT_836589 [Roridomyces roridus]